MSEKILIVDDEPSLVMAVRDELVFEGFDVKHVNEGGAAIPAALDWHPDVVLLDLMLPGINGFEVCRRLRPALPGVWIIFVTARGQEVDRVNGFASGADDYVVKPFSLRELVARVRVGLRRTRPAAAALHTVGDLQIDIAARIVTQAGREIPLTRKEFDILEVLVRRRGEVVSRDDFFAHVWGEDVNVTDRVIDTHVASLRKKIEAGPDQPPLILSVRGLGYKVARS